MVVATSFFYEQVRRTMRTAIVSNLLKDMNGEFARWYPTFMVIHIGNGNQMWTKWEQNVPLHMHA